MKHLIVKFAFVVFATAAVCGVATAAPQFSEDFSTWNSLGNDQNGFFVVTYGVGSSLSDTNNWTITDTSVDLCGGATQFTVSPNDGAWLDLAGSPGPGGIEQTVALAAGNHYLTFRGFTDDLEDIQVWLNGAMAADYDSNALTPDWTNHSLEFSTNGSPLDLLIRTPDPSNGNVGIDSIAINAVPEPAPCCAFGLGLAGLLIRRRR